jgi:hypothetical protein
VHEVGVGDERTRVSCDVSDQREVEEQDHRRDGDNLKRRYRTEYGRMLTSSNTRNWFRRGDSAANSIAI